MTTCFWKEILVLVHCISAGHCLTRHQGIELKLNNSWSQLCPRIKDFHAELSRLTDVPSDSMLLVEKNCENKNAELELAVLHLKLAEVDDSSRKSETLETIMSSLHDVAGQTILSARLYGNTTKKDKEGGGRGLSAEQLIVIISGVVLIYLIGYVMIVRMSPDNNNRNVKKSSRVVVIHNRYCNSKEYLEREISRPSDADSISRYNY